MKGVEDMLLLGDPRLYQKCVPILKSELSLVPIWVKDMHDVMEDIRRVHGFGRGIAAPQLGIMKRLIYINIDRPIVIINPELSFEDESKFTLWDDCMSVPNLLVQVERFKHLRMHYLDEQFNEQTMEASDALSELIQHEYDHLEGILCINRAIDNRSFKWRKN